MTKLTTFYDNSNVNSTHVIDRRYNRYQMTYSEENSFRNVAYVVNLPPVRISAEYVIFVFLSFFLFDSHGVAASDLLSMIQNLTRLSVIHNNTK